MQTFHTGDYEITYSIHMIMIVKGQWFVEIIGKELITMFDTFTDFCENEDAIDVYFEAAKLPTNED